MKRRYKEGDWLRIPLGGERDAIGIIARACRSRLFGYFFPIDAAAAPTPADLKALVARDAVACALFGGAGLEQARWQLAATSLPFERTRWPFPHFRSRGAFGRTWTRVVYDEDEIAIERRESAEERSVLDLPDARIATPEELEDLLRSKIDGEAPPVPLAVCEVHPPVDEARLRILDAGGRVQFSQPLGAEDLERLASLVRAHPGVELRVHGMDEFDAASLERFDALHSLVLNVQRVLNPAALARLHSLRILHLGRTRECMPLSALASLPALHALELRGAHADIAGMHDFPHLRSLTLVDTPAFDAASMRSRETLRALALAHGAYELNSICALPALERLELRDMRAAQLPDLSRAAHLRVLHLRAVRELRDLTPIAAAPALRELRIEAMPQLHVSDFEPLRACASLAKIAVDLQSKAKSREVYRLLALGRIRT